MALLHAAACAGSEPEQPAGSAGAATPRADLDVLETVDETLSAWDRALLLGYEEALRSREVRRASLNHFLRQLRNNPPLAFIDGYWATPVDLGALFQEPGILEALRPVLSVGEHADRFAGLRDGTRRPRRLVGIAFTANPLGKRLELPFVGELARAAAIEPASLDVHIVPVKDVEWAVTEFLPPVVAPPGVERDCYFFCGDPLEWDGDGDGIPDVDDDDDDNDGVPDAADDYPYCPAENDSGQPAASYIGLTTKFSRPITSAVLTARRHIAKPGAASRFVALGRAADTDHEVRFVFPFAPRPFSTATRADDCPDADDPRVRYVSDDAAACARLRFRCKPGEAPFSNECGCGCIASPRERGLSVTPVP